MQFAKEHINESQWEIFLNIFYTFAFKINRTNHYLNVCGISRQCCLANTVFVQLINQFLPDCMVNIKNNKLYQS